MPLQESFFEKITVINRRDMVYAPDSSKSLEIYEACISIVTKFLREERRGGAKEFCITSDLNVDLGMMCTDEKDIPGAGRYVMFLVLARVRQRSWCLQEIDVVRDYERLRLRGHFHVVRVRKSQRTCFYAQTFEPRCSENMLDVCCVHTSYGEYIAMVKT